MAFFSNLPLFPLCSFSKFARVTILIVNFGGRNKWNDRWPDLLKKNQGVVKGQPPSSFWMAQIYFIKWPANYTTPLSYLNRNTWEFKEYICETEKEQVREEMNGERANTTQYKVKFGRKWSSMKMHVWFSLNLFCNVHILHIFPLTKMVLGAFSKQTYF